MATKVTVFGQEEEPKKELKKIEFVKFLQGSLIIDNSYHMPSSYEKIILLETEYSNCGLDLMYAKTLEKYGVLILGNFNDGIV